MHDIHRSFQVELPYVMVASVDVEERLVQASCRTKGMLFGTVGALSGTCHHTGAQEEIEQAEQVLEMVMTYSGLCSSAQSP